MTDQERLTAIEARVAAVENRISARLAFGGLVAMLLGQLVEEIAKSKPLAFVAIGTILVVALFLTRRGRKMVMEGFDPKEGTEAPSLKTLLEDSPIRIAHALQNLPPPAKEAIRSTVDREIEQLLPPALGKPAEAVVDRLLAEEPLPPPPSTKESKAS